MGFQQRPSDRRLLFCRTAIFVFRFTFAFRLGSEVPQIDARSSLAPPHSRCAEKIVSCTKNYTKLCNNFTHLPWKISFSFAPFNLRGGKEAAVRGQTAALRAALSASRGERLCQTRAQPRFRGTSSSGDCTFPLFSVGAGERRAGGLTPGGRVCGQRRPARGAGRRAESQPPMERAQEGSTDGQTHKYTRSLCHTADLAVVLLRIRKI